MKLLFCNGPQFLGHISTALQRELIDSHNMPNLDSHNAVIVQFLMNLASYNQTNWPKVVLGEY